MHTQQQVADLLDQLHKLEEDFKKRHAEIRQKILDTRPEQAGIPAEAFATKLTPYETIVCSLKDHYGLSNKDISEELNKSESSVSNTLRNARKKNQKIPWPDSQVHVPTNIFDNNLSPGQALVLYLYEQGTAIADIARLIGRDPRNVQTTLRRAQERGEAQ